MSAPDSCEWLARYHAEHAGYGGASFEFHARAETYVRDLFEQVARLTKERDEAVKAERERCIEACRDALCDCGEPGCDGADFERRFHKVIDAIKAGKPIPPRPWG